MNPQRPKTRQIWGKSPKLATQGANTLEWANEIAAYPKQVA
jgi:hypothetical protein